LNKIRQYLNTFVLTRGFLIALLASAFIYLAWWGLSTPLLTTFLAIVALFLLLKSTPKVWFWSGFFIGILWFWWIGLSFNHYHMPWAIPLVILLIALGYGLLFLAIAQVAHRVTAKLPTSISPPIHSLIRLLIKSMGLLVLSYIHPFGFDWFKPELMFQESYLGTQKWQFAVILLGVALTHWRHCSIYLLLLGIAYQPTILSTRIPPKDITILSTKTPVSQKWDTTLQPAQFAILLDHIDQAIANHQRIIILPESVFPRFINQTPTLLTKLQERAEKITIVTGGLYWDGKVPRNSTYIFSHSHITVANKVLLVPFGESNPLPDFLSDWVNEVFYDGAVDYQASSHVVDYRIDGVVYRNAICFEATSELLYQGSPKQMIVLSNNGWFVPSTEPTLQRLLLQYYSRKYHTTIYHAVNMSPSYLLQEGRVIWRE